MPYIPVSPGPGVCFSASVYAVGKDSAYVSSGSGSYRAGQGRWASAENVEFIAGYPQKIAGWAAAIQTPLAGIPRCNKNWRGNDGQVRAMIGTTTHLYVWLSGNTTDVTPLQTLSQGTLTNAFTTQNQSTTVAVADNIQTLQNGDWVYLSAGSAVGGLTIVGWFQVAGRTNSGYSITSLVAASSGASGGGTINYEYPRITLTNPFQTTINESSVQVFQTNHGLKVGDFVIYSGGATVGGLSLNGEFQVSIVINGDTYFINTPTKATSSVLGGNLVSVIALINITQVTVIAPPVYGDIGVVYGETRTNYGTSNVTVATLPDGWTLSAYGSQMLCCPVGGTIYVYDPTAGGRAYPLLNAPNSIQAMFVTPERFVVALGTENSPLQLAWCDQNDYTQWVTTATNTANTGRNLIGGSYFVGGLAITTGVSLIWTDKALFQMSYTGSQEIYNTPLLGDNCGLVSPWAATVEGGVSFWMSDQDWWTWSGGSPTALPSDDVRAYVYQATGLQPGLNTQQLGKCCAVLNRAKKQVRFYYPSASSTENDSGMIYQFDSQCWSPLAFARSCGSDSNLLAVPMSCDQTGLLYYDETGTDANGSPLAWSIQVADMDVSNGDKNVDIFGFIPNFQVLVGDCTFIAEAAYYPSDPYQNDGPWPMTLTTQRQDLRLDGKLFAFQLFGSGLGSTMRLGVSRIDVQPAGDRN